MGLEALAHSAADNAATSSAAHRTVGERRGKSLSNRLDVRSGPRRRDSGLLRPRHHSDEGGSAGLRRGTNLFAERRELRAGRHAGTDERRPASPLAWHRAL
jgi:hypothetical protein